MTKLITILDTSIGSYNMGDYIVVDGVRSQLKQILPSADMFVTAPTHEVIAEHSRKMIAQSEYAFVAGTNLLNSSQNIGGGSQWRLRFKDVMELRDLILMGVGWSDYQGRPNFRAKFIYNKILSKQYWHSVRDAYTKEKLAQIGITNVINTGDMTLWGLTPDVTSQIPVAKGKEVITTITDYRADPKNDELMLATLIRNYEKVYLWIQGHQDEIYFDSLSSKYTEKIIKIAPSLEAYDHFLMNNDDLDFVGTRLHAGIRAMQKGHRTLIIGVDNRAIEMQKDFAINVLRRSNLAELETMINGTLDSTLTLNFEGISQWKRQFIDE